MIYLILGLFSYIVFAQDCTNCNKKQRFPALQCYEATCESQISDLKKLEKNIASINLSDEKLKNEKVQRALEIIESQLQNTLDKNMANLNKAFKAKNVPVPKCAINNINNNNQSVAGICKRALQSAIANTSTDEELLSFKSLLKSKLQKLQTVFVKDLSEEGQKKILGAINNIHYTQKPLEEWLASEPDKYISNLSNDNNYDNYKEIADMLVKYQKTSSDVENILCQQLGNPFQALAASCRFLSMLSEAPLDSVRSYYDPNSPTEMTISAFSIKKGNAGVMVFLHESTHALNSAVRLLSKEDKVIIDKRRSCISKKLNLGSSTKTDGNEYVEETISDVYARLIMQDSPGTNLFCEFVSKSEVQSLSDKMCILGTQIDDINLTFYKMYTEPSSKDPHLPSFLRMAIDSRISWGTNENPACTEYLKAVNITSSSKDILDCLK